MKKIDVLNLEWASYPSRDRQTATLVCNYLRYQGFKVKECSIFNGMFYITKFKPSLFFITNSTGAIINHQILKFAKRNNVKVVTLISEGILDEEKGLLDEMIWGHNKEKILYEDKHLQWSEKSRNLSLKYFPDLEGKIKVSGAVGFDLYKIAKRQNRNFILQKYKKDYFKKTIGIGCWDFGIFYKEDPRYEIISKNFSIDSIRRFLVDQLGFNVVLSEVIKNNPNILFILKEHPGCLGGHKASGIDGLIQFENTLIIKNEENIIDCISISDFWLVYESTTAMEAWLMGKQTCLLNPSGIDFIRDRVHKGSPNYPDINSLQSAIEIFYKTDKLPGFDELEDKRHDIIKSTIQWEDGLNHVRAGNEIIDFLRNKDFQQINRSSVTDKINMLKQMFYWYLSPFLFWIKRFREYNYHVKSFNKSGLKEFQTKRMNEQVSYYNKLNLDRDTLLNIRSI